MMRLRSVVPLLLLPASKRGEVNRSVGVRFSSMRSCSLAPNNSRLTGKGGSDPRGSKRSCGLLRGACHWARIRAARWLATGCVEVIALICNNRFLDQRIEIKQELLKLNSRFLPIWNQIPDRRPPSLPHQRLRMGAISDHAIVKIRSSAEQSPSSFLRLKC